MLLTGQHYYKNTLLQRLWKIALELNPVCWAIKETHWENFPVNWNDSLLTLEMIRNKAKTRQLQKQTWLCPGEVRPWSKEVRLQARIENGSVTSHCKAQSYTFQSKWKLYFQHLAIPSLAFPFTINWSPSQVYCVVPGLLQGVHRQVLAGPLQPWTLPQKCKVSSAEAHSLLGCLIHISLWGPPLPVASCVTFQSAYLHFNQGVQRHCRS